MKTTDAVDFSNSPPARSPSVRRAALPRHDPKYALDRRCGIVAARVAVTVIVLIVLVHNPVAPLHATKALLHDQI